MDKFFEFIPHNHVMDEDLIAAFTGLMANKFILPTVGVVEAISSLSFGFRLRGNHTRSNSSGNAHLFTFIKKNSTYKFSCIAQVETKF